jgi:hypothetical protein
MITKDFCCKKDGCEWMLYNVSQPSMAAMQVFQDALLCPLCGSQSQVYLGGTRINLVNMTIPTLPFNFKWGIQPERMGDVDKAEDKFHRPNWDREADRYVKEDAKIAQMLGEKAASEAQYAT